MQLNSSETKSEEINNLILLVILCRFQFTTPMEGDQLKYAPYNFVATNPSQLKLATHPRHQ